MFALRNNLGLILNLLYGMKEWINANSRSRIKTFAEPCRQRWSPLWANCQRIYGADNSTLVHLQPLLLQCPWCVKFVWEIPCSKKKFTLKIFVYQLLGENSGRPSTGKPQCLLLPVQNQLWDVPSSVVISIDRCASTPSKASNEFSPKVEKLSLVTSNLYRVSWMVYLAKQSGAYSLYSCKVKRIKCHSHLPDAGQRLEQCTHPASCLWESSGDYQVSAEN